MVVLVWLSCGDTGVVLGWFYSGRGLVVLGVVASRHANTQGEHQLLCYLGMRADDVQTPGRSCIVAIGDGVN